MKPRSRVLLLLLFFLSFPDLVFFSSAQPSFYSTPLLPSLHSTRFLLSLHSVLLRPLSSFSLFPFVISRALFFFIFFDALLPPHRHLASSLSLLSCLVFPPAVPLLFSSQVRGVSASARRLIYESHASSPTAPRGTANDMCFSTLGIFYPLHPDRLSSSVPSRTFLSRFTSWSSPVLLILQTPFGKSNAALSTGGNCSL